MNAITVRSIAMVFVLALAATATAAAQRYPAPQLLGISSPRTGTVEITMEIEPGENGGMGAFLVYRRQGTHNTPEKFEMLKRGGYPHYFMDTVGSPEFASEEGLVKIIISGLKSGNCSFYITQVAPWISGSESEPSNILTINVAGHMTDDGDIDGNVVPWSSASVATPVAIEQVTAYPNPALTQVRMPLPGNAGTLRVFDATGAEVMKSTFGGGVAEYVLDVTRFAAGTYFAETVSGDRVARSRFTVVR
jgi:hypothetical protein